VAQWACQPEEEADETARMFGPADLSSVEAEPGRSTRFGEYQLLEEIGRGGMGIVYRARQLRLNRLVAVKMIPFGSLAGEQFIRRFRTEAEAVAQLQHPNIIGIHEVGEWNGQQFFSMDYIAGGTLDDLLRPGPLPPGRAAEYLQTIAKAIHYAHQRGILHRDLKPSNILIDEQGQPRISDFGLAKRVATPAPEGGRVQSRAPAGQRPPEPGSTAAGPENDLTLTGQVLGSPNYMSPEQACPEGNEASASSDVYSLGAMLYHALTGRPPFQAENIPALLFHLVHDEPVVPRALLPTIPRDLETICLKCLAKEPARRYASAAELADELGRFLADEPILAKPAGLGERLWRWGRRKPALAGTLALLMAVGLTGAVGILLQWRRAEGAFGLTRENLYAADMELAYRAFANGDRGYARQLLVHHQPADPPVGVDLRGWEWRYLWAQCQGEEQFTLGSHGGAVVSLDYSPTGQWLASADVRGGLTIWNITSRQAQFSTNLLEGRVNALAFSADGQILAQSTPNQISLWETARWQRTRTLPQRQVLHLAFSPDGTVLAAANGREVCLWRPAAAVLWKRLSTSAREPEPGKLAFTARGELLAVADANGRVTYWDWHADTERESWRAHRPSADWEESGGNIEDMVFSPTRDLLATAGGDKSIRLWTRPRQYVPLTNHTEAVMSVAFTRDGRRLVSGGMDQTVRLWDVAQHRELGVWHAHADGCLQVRWAPDGRSFASAGMDGTVKIWNPERAPTPPPIKQLPADTVDVIIVPPVVALTTADHGWQVWQAGTFDQIYRGVGLTNTDAALKSARSGVFIEWSGREIQFRRLADGQLEPFAFSDQGEVISVDLARDGRSLAVSAIDGLSLWDVPARRLVRRWETPNQGMHRHVRLAPDGSCIVTLQRFDGTVNFYDLRTSRTDSLPGHMIGASVVSFSPDGRWLATVGLGSALRVYDVAARREQLTLENRSGHLTALAFSTDGRRLAGGTSKGPITIWDLSTGRAVAWLTGHESLIYSLAFLDSDTLASATHREIRLWTAARTGAATAPR
jgi:WD40 repeat protein/serine/threonine protein kinase